MVRSYTRVGARETLSLAFGALTAVALLITLLHPASALAYYGHPSTGDNYVRYDSYMAAQGGPGSEMSPTGFATAPDGNMWAVSNDNLGIAPSLIQYYVSGDVLAGSLVVHDFTGDGGTEKDYTSLSGLTFGPDGKLYTCCGSDSMVLRIDPASGLVLGTIGDSSVFSSPTDLEFDRNGNLFVVDAYWGTPTGTYGRVVRYNPTFTSYTAFYGDGSADGPLSVPQGLSIDALNDVWVADSYNDRVVEFSNSGSGVLSVFPGGPADQLYRPQDVYVDGYGTIYIVDQTQTASGSSRFLRLASDGSSLGSYPATSGAGTLNSPSKIAVNSMVFGGDVFLNNNLTPDTNGVAGDIERWQLLEADPDLTAPVTTSNAPSTWQYNTPVVVSLSATDTQSGVQVTRWGFSPSVLATYTTPISISAEGSTTIYYQSVDLAGNVETLQHKDILIDHSTPLTTSNIQPTYYVAPSASLVASDFASGVAATWWRVDGSAWATGTTPFLDASFGSHTLDWYSVDVAGNKETTHTAIYEMLSRTEQTDPRISLLGAWSTTSDASASAGSYASTNHTGDKAVLTFRGTRLDCYAIKGPAYGIASAKLDGGTAVNVDLYASSKSYKQKVWTSGNVTDATHTVEFDYTATKNASATSATVNVDAFDTVGYIGQADVTPPTTTSDAPAGWARPDVYVTLSASDDISGVDSTYYSTNGTTPTVQYTAPIKFSAEGTSTLLFHSVDRVGNTETTQTATLRLDGTAPNTTSTVQPAYVGTATILLSAADTLSGVSQTLYSLDGAAATSGTVVTTSLVGSHTLSFHSSDAAGNTEVTRTVGFDVTRAYDNTDPKISYRGTWTPTGSGGAYGGSYASADASGCGVYMTFSGTRIDLSSPTGPAMGIAHVWVDGSDAGMADFYSASPASQQRVFALAGLSDTTHTVNVQWTGSKNAASTGTAVALDSVDVVSILKSDTIKPITTSNIAPQWQQGQFTLVLNPSDQGTWVTTTYASVNGSTTVYTAPITITTDGTSTVKFWSVDAAGNTEATNTASVLIDPNAPTSADNVPVAWQRTPFTVSLNATDTESGVLKILYIIGQGQQYLYTAPFAVSTEGTNDIKYYSVDNVGNAEAMHTAELQIDTSNPITTDNAPAGWVKGPVDVSLVASDAYSGVAQTLYGLNGAVPSISATVPVHIAAEGTTTIAYRSSDVAGNVESTHTAYVRIDNTAPHTTSDCAASYAGTGTVTLSPTDSVSGIASTVWRIDSGSWTTGTVVSLPFVAGFHTLQWASADVAGNVEATQSATYQMMQRWEQTDARFYFKGSWAASSSGSYSGGSARSVNATQSSLYLDFTGTRFDLISATGPGYGKALITIDGTTTPATVDLYSASNVYQWRAYSNPNLANTSHIVRIDWTGTKNAASTGTTICVDAADLIGQLNTDTVAPTTTSDASSAWRSTNETVTLSPTDVHSFVANSYYKTGSTTTTYSAPFAISAEGTTALQFWSVDAAGNVEATNSVNVRIDRTAPVTSDDSTSTWQRGPVTVHLTSVDAGCGVATIYYSLDGSNPSLVATGGVVTVSAEGTTTLKYKAVDTLGNTETAKSATIKIDNSAPGTANNAAAGWVKSPASVTLTASDTLSGIANTYFSVDGSNPSIVVTGPVNVTNDGTTTLKYYSRDNAGNAETTKSVSVKVDAVAPVTTATVAPEYQTTATIILVPTDTESGVANTYWRIDGSAWTTGSVATTTTGGTHQLDFYSTDAVGNIEGMHSVSFDVALRYETSSSYIAKWPSSYWYSQSNSSYSGGAERYTSYHNGYSQFVFNGTGFHIVASKASGYGTGTVTVDGGSTMTVDFSATSTVYQQRVVNVTGLANTQHVVRLTCTNALSKQIRFDAVDIVGVLNTQSDVTPPTTTDNTDLLWHKGGFDVALSASDSLSGIAGTYYTLNGGAQQSYSGTFTVSTEGTNTLQYYSVDTAANQEDTNTANVLVDSTAPNTTDDAPVGWSGSPVTVHLNATDALSGVAGTVYSVNGSAAATYTAGVAVAAEGVTSIAYRSTDVAGNAETTKTATVRLDFTAPVTSSNATSSYVNTATVTLSPTDAGSGVAQTLWRLDGSAWTSGTVASTAVSGPHTLDFHSSDALGHLEATKTVSFDVVKRFEQDDSRLNWTGSWSLISNGGLSGGTMRNSNTASSCVYAAFSGTRIDWIGSKNGTYGQARVTVDGGAPTTVDLYGTFAFQQTLWSSGELPNGIHTLKIEVLHSHAASSTEYWVSADAFDIHGTLVQDTYAPVTTATGNATWATSPVTLSLSATDTGSWVAGTYYKIAGGQTTTYTIPFTISAEGTTPVTYWSVDGAGNTETSSTLNVRIDRIAPATSDDAPSSWVHGPCTLHLNAVDSGSGTSATYYSLNGTAPSLLATGPITVSAEGTSTLRYYSVDNAGNAAAETSRSIRIDNTAPSSTSDAPSGWVGGPVDVNLTASDGLSGIAAVRYAVNGSAASTYTAPIHLATEGATSIAWAAVDQAGNVEPTRTATVSIDNTAPQTSDDAPSGWVSAPVTVSITASDSVSGVGSTYYSLDGTTPTVPYAGPLVVSGEGATTLRYFSVDTKGNVESIHSTPIFIDSYAPTSTDDAPEGWTQGPVSVTITATDAVSGVAQTLYSADGSAPSIPVTGPITFASEGTSTLSYRSLDIKGNLEPIRSDLVLIDNTAPNTSSNAQASYNGTATVTLSPADGLSGVASTTWRLDGSAWSTGTVATTSVGGHHTLEWYSTDLAGNAETTQSAQFDVVKRIDDSDSSFVWQGAWSTPSSGSLYGGAYHSTNATGSSAYFTFLGTSFTLVTSKSTDFGIASVSVDGGTPTDVDLYSSVTPFQQKVFTVSHLSNTIHLVRIDWTGRKNDASTNTKIGVDAMDIVGATANDNTPPTSSSNAPAPWVKGPVSVSLFASDAQNFVAATYYQVNSANPATYTAPFSVSSEGTNTLAFWSVDGVGNRESTQTTAVRVDNTAPVTSNDAPAGWSALPVTLHLSATDSLSGVAGSTYSVNGSAVATYAGSITVAAEGVNTIAYASIDAAGNLESTHTVPVKIDLSAPVTTATVAGSYLNTATISLSAADTGCGVAQTVWSIDGSAWTSGTVASTTTPGTHTLSFYSVDALGHAESPRSVQFGLYHRYEQTDSTLIWTGTWSTNNNVGFSGGSAKTSSAGGSSLYATFSGSRVTWLGSKNTSYGQARVTVDGGVPVIVDDYGSFAFQQKLWDSGDLANTTHTLRIDVLASKNASSTGYTVSADAFDVLGTISGDVLPPVTNASLSAPAWSSVPVTVSLSAADTGSWVAGTYYRLAGGQTTTYTAPFSISTEGTTPVTFWSVDGVGNVEASKTVNVLIDRTLPVTSDDAPSAWVKGPVSVNLTAIDSTSGIAATLYSLDGSAPSLACTGPIVISSEGTTTLKYCSVDRAGNAEQPITRTVRVDNTAPTSADDAPVSGWTPSLVHVTAADGLSGVAGVCYTINGSTVATYVAGIPLPQDGTNTVTYRAVDVAGNTEATHTVVVKADTVAPVTTCNALSTYYYTTATVTLVPTDTLSGVAMTSYSLDGGALTSGTVLSVSSAGHHTLSFFSTDRAGNAETAKSASFDIYKRYEQTDSNILYQGTWATANSGSLSGGSWSKINAAGGAVNVSFVGSGLDWITSKASSLGKAKVTVDGQSATFVDLYSAGTYFQQKVWSVAGLPNALHTVRIEWTGTMNASSTGAWVGADAFDVAGPLAQVPDTTSPTTSCSADSMWHTSPSVTVTMTATDDLTGVAATYYRLDGSATATYTTPITVSTDGAHSLLFWSTDMRGNVEPTHTAQVLVDHTSPTTTSTVVPSYAATASISLVASDGASGVALTQFRLDASAWTTGSAITTSAPGAHTLDFRSTDAAGNLEATKTVMFGIKQRMEQTDPRLGFVGTWSTVNNGSFSNGSYVFANALGAAANLTFTGTKVDWISSKSSNYGQASVSVDGSVPTTISLYAPAPAFQQLIWSSGNLAGGTHTLRIEWLGSKDASSSGTSVGIDALDVYGTPATATASYRYEQDDSRLALLGTWSPVTHPSLSAGSFAYANTLGGAANITFVGSRLDWITSRNTSYGQATVSVDGTSPVTIDLYGPWAMFQQNVWTTGDLPYGSHSVRIEWTGSKNASSTGTAIGIDALNVTGVLTKAPTTARYEETDPRLAYVGVWNNVPNAGLSAGNYKSTQTLGSAANITFVGSGVNWITSKASNFGIAKVVLDGGTPQSVDLYSSSAKFQQNVWSASGLTYGQHTLRIEWTGTKNASSSDNFIGLDAVDINGVPVQAKQSYRYEQTDPLVAWQGQWQDINDVALSGGSYRNAVNPGAVAYIYFTGSGLDWITSKAANFGIANLILDGGAPQQVDLYSSSAKFQQAVWSASGLTFGPHTLRIEYTGTKNSSSSGPVVGVDAFDVTGVLTQAKAVTRYEETDARLKFTGAWTTKSDPALSGGAYKSSVATGDLASVAFTGTGVDWIGSQTSKAGTATVVLDGGAPVTVDLASASSVFQAKVFSAQGLTDGPHTLTITANSGTPINVDAIDVSGILTQAP